MTTLEIVRLDSGSSIRKSPSHSPNYNDRLSSSHINSGGNSKTNEYLHEIPINIIKSPSYTNSIKNSPSKKLVKTTPLLLSVENVNLTDRHSQSLNDNHKTTSNTTSKTNSAEASSASSLAVSNQNTNNKLNMSSTTNSSSGRLYSEDIDDVINTNSSTLANELEEKSNTRNFNRYGFMQPDFIGTGGTDTNSKRSSVNQNSLNKKGSSQQINSANSVQSLTTSKSMSTNDDGMNTNKKNSPTKQMPITNLKDYIQNTDVEEFAEHLPIDVIRSRETKWIDMLANFNDWMEKRFKKIKSRCRKGIPQSIRSRAWMHLTGAYILKHQRPNYFQDCLNNVKKHDVAKYLDDIKKDLHRQFPSHEIFMKKEGRQMLFNVLKAYAVHNREVGYCQAQGPIAALLLMHMPEEDSFWMLVRISDYYLKGYFKPGLEKVQIDGQALFILFKKENQVAFKLMKSQGIDPILYMTEWFMCVFARTLPWCTVLRVWDMFFCEGVKVLYRVGLYLMSSAFGDKEKFTRCQTGMYETLNLLKNLPIESLHEGRLVVSSSEIKFTEDDLKKAFEKSRKEFQKNADELTNRRANGNSKNNLKKKT